MAASVARYLSLCWSNPRFFLCCFADGWGRNERLDFCTNTFVIGMDRNLGLIEAFLARSFHFNGDRCASYSLPLSACLPASAWTPILLWPSSLNWGYENWYSYVKIREQFNFFVTPLFNHRDYVIRVYTTF